MYVADPVNGAILQIIDDGIVLDEDQNSCTMQLTGPVARVDEFIDAVAEVGEISAVARSGTVAVSKGEVTLTSFDRQHLLVG